MAKTNYSPTFPMYPGDAASITPSDSTNLATPSIVFVGGTGNVTVRTAQGSDVLFFAVPGGAVLPVQVIRVFATGTTASNLVRIF
jgi:hypothetical protein